MWRYGMFILIVINIILCSANATNINCAAPGSNIMAMTLPSNISLGDKVTVGLTADYSSYRELYTWKSTMMGSKSVSCTPATAQIRIYQYVTSMYGEPVKYNDSWIFPTAIDGIGVSFNEMRYSGGAAVGDVNNPLYFYDTILGNNSSTMQNMIKIWKMPGKIGVISGELFSGFQVVHAYQLKSSSDSFSKLPSYQANYPMPRSITVAAVTYSGSIKLIPGTCNFINKTVQMGSHARSVIGNSSPWVNASFTLNCPEAWGYGMTATMSKDTNNTIKSRSANTATKGIIVTVIPRYDIIDSARGVIGLKPGGAEGYGIQLAWGDASSLPAGDPARPVLFGQSQVVSDENFGTSGNTYTREINMAARYLRTTGTVKGGKADSAIEILASYN